MRQSTIRDSDRLIDRYRIEQRLQPDQLEIFRVYLASYCVLSKKENSNMLDLQTDVEADMLHQLALTKPLARWLDSTVEVVRKTSRDLRDEGNELGKAYLDRHGESASLHPNTLLRVSNVVDTFTKANPDTIKRDLAILSFLDKELPIK